MDLDFARQVLRTEAEAVGRLPSLVDAGFEEALALVIGRTGERPAEGGGSAGAHGRLAVTGVGKAGRIADKLAATFASTGTPAYFLNPTDALHGDLGMVSSDDVALALSNSGRTQELLRLVPHLRKIGVPVIAMTGDPASPLASPEFADAVVVIGDTCEACPLGLAPSSSTTAMLAMGDAMALTVQKERGFTGEKYAQYHPAGELARRAVRVRDIMRTGERVARAGPGETLAEVVRAVTAAKGGAACVTDPGGVLLGIFTDGDLRRALARDPAALSRPVGDLMTRGPRRTGPDRLVAEAMALMRDARVNGLPVADDAGRVVGFLDVQDIVGLRLEV